MWLAAQRASEHWGWAVGVQAVWEAGGWGSPGLGRALAVPRGVWLEVPNWASPLHTAHAQSPSPEAWHSPGWAPRRPYLGHSGHLHTGDAAWVGQLSTASSGWPQMPGPGPVPIRLGSATSTAQPQEVRDPGAPPLVLTKASACLPGVSPEKAQGRTPWQVVLGPREVPPPNHEAPPSTCQRQCVLALCLPQSQPRAQPQGH